MARNRDVPGWFAHIDEKRSLPLRAELTVAAVVIALVLTIDITSSIAVSGVAVLTYYAVTNAAAITLRAISGGGPWWSRSSGWSAVLCSWQRFPTRRCWAAVWCW